MNEVLSELEWQVLNAYIEGKSYNEISQKLNRHVKSIDNALQRVKRKLEQYLKERDKEIIVPLLLIVNKISVE